MQAAEKKRAKEEKDIVHRLRPFSRLQTAEDFEVFAADILCTFSSLNIYFHLIIPFRRSHAAEENPRASTLPTDGLVNGCRYR